MGPPLPVEGGATGAVFEAYVGQVLTPSLSPGQVVEMDTFSAHKGERVRELVEEVGCEVLFPPSYSPDLSPIEEAFSQTQSAAAPSPRARTKGALGKAIGQALERSRTRTLKGGSATVAVRFGVNYHENRCRPGLRLVSAWVDDPGR